ncbi:hypothetical protein A7985_18080 [Pseudoalteromonas luteoviolacea]|uniref:DUF2946 domain-containing protein n=1 Tax=Pseudoalteromonas luteoviolacea TaxID=43657 RepID=A0A1C0TLU3_9GAMM|nr:hypothetical protein A7985_18080 [Pseudoalteromonas luteoviolacea]
MVYAILTVVVALQSVSSVASLSELNLVDARHLQTNHAHQHDEQVTTTVKLDEHGHAVQDCHHCGHCTGSHTSWVSVESVSNASLDTSGPIFCVTDRRVRKRVESTFRPPIYS